MPLTLSVLCGSHDGGSVNCSRALLTTAPASLYLGQAPLLTGEVLYCMCLFHQCVLRSLGYFSCYPLHLPQLSSRRQHPMCRSSTHYCLNCYNSEVTVLLPSTGCHSVLHPPDCAGPQIWQGMYWHSTAPTSPKSYLYCCSSSHRLPLGSPETGLCSYNRALILTAPSWGHSCSAERAGSGTLSNCFLWVSGLF